MRLSQEEEGGPKYCILFFVISLVKHFVASVSEMCDI